MIKGERGLRETGKGERKFFYSVCVCGGGEREKDREIEGQRASLASTLVFRVRFRRALI